MRLRCQGPTLTVSTPCTGCVQPLNCDQLIIGTPLIVSDASGSPYRQMWFIEPVTNEADTYTMRNLSTGLYAGLDGGMPYIFYTGIYLSLIV